MCADELNKISLTGKVEKRTLGGTSKMAHTGFVLQTRDGAIKLRRDQGNPFNPALSGLLCPQSSLRLW